MINFLNHINKPEEKRPSILQEKVNKKSPEELKAMRINNLKKNRIGSKVEEKPKPEHRLDSSIQKKRKTKSEINNSWTRDHKLVSIDPPVENKTNPNIRYSVSFKFFCPSDNKIKKRTIKFGEAKKEYFIHHQDETKNKKMMSNFKAYYSPFHKNFWVLSLLCSENTLNKAYTKLLENIFK
ncbi:MAG TPA: hypothetical protein PKD57_12725 [Saprospiraceae bacterium]|nr:hypothetical protein [Saprospiraceae bacterium]